MSVLPFAASGDPAFDRRLDWARAYGEAGETEVAAQMLADLVAEAPDFAAAWFLLGEMREQAGDRAGAIAAYGEILVRAPDDPFGAGLRLARLGATVDEGAMSPAYVRTLFDQYAERFDEALRTRLAYRGPELLAEALNAACRKLGRVMRFACALDMGCGTGLAAPYLAEVAERLEGVDLSPAMLAQADRLGLYGALHEGEMGAVLAQAAPRTYDLILAADALCYVADLSVLFQSAASALAPGGLFAFTLETYDGDDVMLRETLRYAHGVAHLAEAATASGLAILHLGDASARMEHGVPVPGLVVVLAHGQETPVMAAIIPAAIAVPAFPSVAVPPVAGADLTPPGG